jgi:hypothetical protein
MVQSLAVEGVKYIIPKTKTGKGWGTRFLGGTGRTVWVGGVARGSSLRCGRWMGGGALLVGAGERWLVGEELREVGELEQLRDAAGEVGELEGAVALIERGDLEGDEDAEAGAVDVGDVSAVDDDVAALFDERLDEILEGRGGVADEPAVAGDGGALPVLFVHRFFNFEGKRCSGFRCHGGSPLR